MVPGYNQHGWFEVDSRPVVRIHGQVWDLSYLTGDPDVRLYGVGGINASGQIVASGSGRGQWSNFLLTPE